MHYSRTQWSTNSSLIWQDGILVYCPMVEDLPSPRAVANILKFMSLTTIPVSEAKRLEAIPHRFLWGDSDDKRRSYLVMWDMVKQPFQRGKLGVRFWLSSTRLSKESGFGGSCGSKVAYRGK